MGTDCKLASLASMRAASATLFLILAVLGLPSRARAEDPVPAPQDGASDVQPQADSVDVPPAPPEEPADTASSPPLAKDSDAPEERHDAPAPMEFPTAEEIRSRPPKEDIPELPEPKLPEDAPPASDNELTAQVGWNSDTPVGLRYLRRVEGTPVSFGLGLGLVTMWGPKLSAIVRLQTSFERGFFAQVSAGYAQGGPFTQQVTPPGQSAQTAHLVRTASRTADLMVGWRLPLDSNFLEASAGYSFNLQGTVLQEQTLEGKPNREQVPIDPSSIPFGRAGGFAGAVAYGWLF